MPNHSIPFYVPSVGEEEISELTDVIRSTWVTSGPKVAQFEKIFAERVGAKAALALHSCTAALHLSLVCHAIGPGDEVIVPDITFCSTANVVEHCGAKPVLVDVEPGTLTIDPQAVTGTINEKTKAVIAVHYAGQPADLDALREICQRHDLILIEDAAHAFPTTYKGETIGSGDNPAAFSFYSTKNITTGEGGMLTGSTEFIEKARQLSVHGLSKAAWQRYQPGGTWRYDVEQPGFKYNMTEMQAALGLAQLQKLDAMQKRRKEIAGQYDRPFTGLPGVSLLSKRADSVSSNHLYVLRIDSNRKGLNRDQFIEAMQKEGIGTSVHFIPVHQLSYYREKYNIADAALPVASRAFKGLVSLPLYPSLEVEQVDFIIDKIGHCLRK